MGLIDEIIAESKEEPLDGYYKYVDPAVRARKWKTKLNIDGFVHPNKPKDMYIGTDTIDQENVKAHEFEHTQQLRNGRKEPTGRVTDRWDLAAELYPYDTSINKQIAPKEWYVRETGTNSREFLATLAGLFRSHQDPEMRKKIEDMLKKSPAYKDIQRDLYPTLNHLVSSDQPSTPLDTPMSMMDLARRWIRNKTAY